MIDNGAFGLWFGLLWCGLCASATFALVWAGKRGRSFSYRHVGPGTIVIVALVARLSPAILLNRGSGFDVESYRIIGMVMRAGQSPYIASLAQGRYPYLPFQMYLSEAAFLASIALHVPFVVLAKLPGVVCDSLLTGSIMAGSLRHGYGRSHAVWAGLVYAVNPVSVMVTTYHGQFDALPLLALVAAWSLLATPRRSVIIAAGICVGLAVLMKTWPILLLPAFIYVVPGRLSRVYFVLCALTIPAVWTLAYSASSAVSLATISHVVIHYHGVQGYWGTGFVECVINNATHVLTPAHLQKLYSLTTLAGVVLGFAACWWTRHRGIPDMSVALILSVYAVAAGWGAQYLIWVMPFALISGAITSTGGFLFLVTATGGLAFDYLVAGGVYGTGLDLIAGLYYATSIVYLLVYVSTVVWLMQHLHVSKPGTRIIQTQDASTWAAR